MDRRTFLSASTLAALSPLLPAIARSNPRKRILVLGGTNFVGPAIVDAALAAGHEVTLFNRGITRPHLYPDVEKLVGDRQDDSNGFAALGKRRTWDAVVDVWASEASLVDTSSRVLAERVDHYHYVSSIAAYADFSKAWMDETTPTRLRQAGYGGEKARSEALVSDRFPDRFGISRCPPIFGPRDPGSSLHFWLRNFAANAEVLGPGTGNDPLQFVDVRDVGNWIIRSIEHDIVGVHNTMAQPIALRECLSLCREVTNSEASITWVPKDFLYERRVEAFAQLPLWVPVEEDPGFLQMSTERARKRGFETRPHRDTIAGAWQWYQSAFFNDTVFPHNGNGISWNRQAELLAEWRETSSG